MSEIFAFGGPCIFLLWFVGFFGFLFVWAVCDLMMIIGRGKLECTSVIASIVGIYR